MARVSLKSSELEVDTDDLLLGTASQKTLVLEQVVWDDLRVSAQSTRLNPATTKPDYAAFPAGNGTLTYLFDPGDIESVHFAVQLPHSYKLESDLYPHIHWAPVSTNTGTVRWGLEYTIAKINATFGNTTTIYVEDAGDGTTNKHQTASFSAISGSGIDAVSAMIICRLFRDASHANDSYDNDAALLEFDVHYQIDTIGSRQELTK